MPIQLVYEVPLLYMGSHIRYSVASDVTYFKCLNFMTMYFKD